MPPVRGVVNGRSTKTGGTSWYVDLSSLAHFQDIIADGLENPSNNGIMLVACESVFPDDDNDTEICLVFLDDMEEFCWLC